MISAKEFAEQRYRETNWSDDNLCPPPTDPQYCMNLIFKIVFGEDAYETMPLRNDQVNTHTMYEILHRYDWKKKPFIEKVKCVIHDFIKGCDD